MSKSSRIERARKPAACPACGHRPVATILYGLPVFDSKLEQSVADGRTILGGCVIDGDDPLWQCTQCGQQIYRRKS